MAATPVIDLQAERDARSEVAFREFQRAYAVAQATTMLADMATAVRAFDAWMRIAGLTEAQRREILG